MSSAEEGETVDQDLQAAAVEADSAHPRLDKIKALLTTARLGVTTAGNAVELAEQMEKVGHAVERLSS